ncbi:MAG: YdcF family protein [Shimia sp.]
MIRALALAFLATVLAVAGVQMLPFQSPERAELIVLLGGTDAIRERVPRAVELYEAGYAPRILITGGSAEGRAKSEYMRDAAIAAGIPGKAILVETASLSTIQNALLSAPLIGEDSYLLVTDASHLPRAWLAFRAVTHPPEALVASGQINGPREVLREAAAIWFNALRGSVAGVAALLGAPQDRLLPWLA